MDFLYKLNPFSRWVRNSKTKQSIRDGRKIGRNEECPCGSGKKFKKCCGNS